MRCPWLLLALPLVGCAGTAKTPEAVAADAASIRSEVAGLLSGSFSSQAQSVEDQEYFDIRLRVVPIWLERADGPWLYVEQAAASALDRPYRQRVYHIVGGGDAPLRSVVLALPGDPMEFAGAWRDADPLANVTPDQLEERTGCSMTLVPRAEAPGTWLAATHEQDCESSLRGATYATSEVTLTPDFMESWDRGFDASGDQVWGAVKGPYRFDRVDG